jgi:hypothetical protein
VIFYSGVGNGGVIEVEIAELLELSEITETGIGDIRTLKTREIVKCCGWVN